MENEWKWDSTVHWEVRKGFFFLEVILDLQSVIRKNQL